MGSLKPGAVVRLVDVADYAHVGTSVVSRVLNHDPTLSIRDETRQRILDAAKALDYRPNAFARGLKLAKTMTIGLVINLSYSENAQLIGAIERRAADHGYMTLLADANEFMSHGESYRRLLLERRVDGLLIATGLGEDGFLKRLGNHGVPVVSVNRRLDAEGPSISLDDEAGMRMALEHLIRLGHRRIAYIGGPAGNDIARRRLAGYKGALHASGLRVPSRLVTHSSHHEQGGLDAMERLLKEDKGPTAVAVWSVTVAVGVLAAIRRSGLAVPSDISVIALHDAPIVDYLDPPLATVRLPIAKMAKAAVDSVLDLASQKSASDVIISSPKPALIRRGSTASPA
jgi:LacI family transcriptional regulator